MIAMFRNLILALYLAQYAVAEYWIQCNIGGKALWNNPSVPNFNSAGLGTTASRAAQLYAVTWGGSRPCTRNAGASNGVQCGLPNLNEFIITKALDASSPTVFGSMTAGVPSQSSTCVIVYTANGSTGSRVVSYWNMKTVQFSNYDVAPGDALSEEITILYSSVQMTYVPVDANGNAQTPVSAAWNTQSGTSTF